MAIGKYIVIILLIIYIIYHYWTLPSSYITIPVYDPNKTNVTLIYANWCSHCKEIKPFFEDLVRSQPHNHINYRMFEQNDGPQYYDYLKHIKGYPTLIIDGTHIRDKHNAPIVHSGSFTEHELNKKIKHCTK